MSLRMSFSVYKGHKKIPSRVIESLLFFVKRGQLFLLKPSDITQRVRCQ
jgi:hypothetical protein